MRIQLGRVEISLLLLLAAEILLAWLGVFPLLLLVVRLLIPILVILAVVKLGRWVARNALWRLRNRLVVAYLFIGLVPIVLICALVGFAVYLIAGQISTHLVNTEIDRRTAALRSVAELLVNNPSHAVDWDRNVAPYLKVRFPGVIVVVRGQDSKWNYPPDADVEAPPDGWKEASGLVVKNNY